MKHILLILLFSIHYALGFAQYNPDVHGVPEIEYDALVAFYNATNGDNWQFKSNWLSQLKPVGEWYGITVEKGRVTNINLFITYNSLLPSQIYNLTELKEITLINGRIVGGLTSEISNLTKLEILDIKNMSCYVDFPIGIVQLKYLEILNVSSLYFHEPYPDFSNLKNLKKLDLEGCKSMSKFPKSVLQLLNLEYLSLRNVGMQDTIPDEINDLKKLNYLDLGYCSLNENKLPSLVGIDSLKILQLWTNNFTKIPDWIYECKSLERIDFSDNKIEGKIPTNFSNLPNLSGLHLHRNNFEAAPIPNLSACLKLNSLGLTKCNLIGEIPSWMAEKKEWSYLALWDNDLYGEIPKELLYHNKAYVLIDNNKFSEINLPSDRNIDCRLTLTGNKLEFKDIVPALNLNSGYTSYNPQDSIGIKTDTTLYTRSNFTLDINSQYEGNIFQWYKNDVPFKSASTISAIELESISVQNTGSYRCEVTNPAAPELTLYSRPINISVIECVSQIIQKDTILCAGELFNMHSAEGVYSDTLTSHSGCDSIINSSISFYPSTTSTITTFADTLRCDMPYQSYQWYCNNEIITESDAYTLEFTKNGSYYVLGTDENGCLNKSETIFAKTVGFDQAANKNNEFSIYPNLSAGLLIIEFNNPETDATVSIFNLQGQVILNTKKIDEKVNSINISHFKKGLYIVSISNKYFKRTQKIELK